MKKALFLMPILLLGLASCGGGGGDSVKAKFNFAGVTDTSGKGFGSDYAATTTKFMSFKVEGSESITITENPNVYWGNGQGGVMANKGGLVKFGKSAENGRLKFTVSSNVSKIVLNCHSFYGSTDQYPTNENNYIRVNGSNPVALPYNATGAGEDLTFAVNSNEITIETYYNPETPDKGARGVIYSMTLLG